MSSQSDGTTSVRRPSDQSSEPGSDTEDYYKDVAEFLHDVTSDVMKKGDEELHWSDIGWPEEETSPSLLSQIFSTISNKLWRTEADQIKLLFTSSVLTQFFKAWAVSAGQAFLPWYFVLTTPPLILWRVYTYTQQNWQYFCLDYCYFGNLAIFLILLFAPSSPSLFVLQFSIANGLLYTGAFSFRNSLVFHSVDKMTSTYIHSAPVFLVFGIRWFPEEASRFWHSSFPSEFLPWSWEWNVFGPLLFCACHAVFYTVLVYGILKPGKDTITSFRYLKTTPMARKLFRRPRFHHFLGMQFFIVSVMSLVTILTYTYFWLHVLQVLFLVVVVTWNGATYYVDVFRMSLVKKKK